MSDSKRSFTVLVADAKYNSGPDKGKRIEEVGRYRNADPQSAGKKAASRLFNESGLDDVTFILRETTRGSDNLHYVYRVQNKKLPKPVTYTRKTKLPDGKIEEQEIVQTHKKEIKSIRDETELRTLYNRLNMSFPHDVQDSDGKKKTLKRQSMKKITEKKKSSKTGGALADTAAPVEDSQEGGSTQCCQHSPVEFEAAGAPVESFGDLSKSQADQKLQEMMESREKFLNEA